MLAKVIRFVKLHQFDIFCLICVILIGWICYNLGQLKSITKTPITVGQDASILQAIASSSFKESGGIIKAREDTTPFVKPVARDLRVVVSKNADPKNKKYHYSWCASGKRIKPENQVWFTNEILAQQAGYTLAGNCQ